MKEQNGWQLKGNAPEAYEKYIVPAFGHSWAKDIVERAALKKDDRILDLACGTGLVARCSFEALGKAGHITGIDINEAMIKKAREICPTKTTSIEWERGDVNALPFSNSEFDVILCQQGFQYFSDKSRALKEINRVLSASGRLLFSVWRDIKYFPFYLALSDALKQYVSPEYAKALASAFSLGDSTFLREILKTAGFKKIHINIAIKQMRFSPIKEFLIGGFAGSPFANEILTLEQSIRDEMFNNICDALSDYADDDGLAAPMESYVVTAYK